MKTKKLLLLGFVLMLTISVGSFVFLNSVTPDVDSMTTEQEAPKLDENESIVLPDVQLIQRFLESGKQIMRFF